jgi:hypothetical protein
MKSAKIGRAEVRKSGSEKKECIHADLPLFITS